MNVTGVIMSMIKKAKIFSIKHHEGQYRKYTNDPYIIHPIAVSEIVKSVKHNEAMICAALLHDTVEDTNATLDQINDLFGSSISNLVEMLTDISKPEDGNRFIRKRIDLAHTALSSPEAKTIKLADLIDNTHSIVKYDKNFAKVYLREKLELLEVLKDGNSFLWEKARQIAERGLIICHM